MILYPGVQGLPPNEQADKLKFTPAQAAEFNTSPPTNK